MGFLWLNLILEYYAKKWQRFFAEIVRKNKRLDRCDDSEISHNDLVPEYGNKGQRIFLHTFGDTLVGRRIGYNQSE
jgi:hypothetical protein